MTAYEMKKIKKDSYSKHREDTQIKSISTYWMIAVVAIVFAAGFLANLV